MTKMKTRRLEDPYLLEGLAVICHDRTTLTAELLLKRQVVVVSVAPDDRDLLLERLCGRRDERPS